MPSHSFSSLSLLVLTLASLAACVLELPEQRFPCSSDKHCAPGFLCDLEEGICRDAAAVARPSPDDAGVPVDGGLPPDGHDPQDGGAEDAGRGEDAGKDLPPTVRPLELLCEEATPCPFTLESDDDGPLSALEGRLVSPPLRGSVSSFDGLEAVYTSAPHTMGEDRFTVRVSDGEQESEELVVRVRVLSRRSCAHLLLSGAASESGVYSLLPNGPGSPPLEAYCEMERAGGGWALALKADGREPTFEWDSPLWTDELLHNEGSQGLDDEEAKLAAFRELPLAQTLLLMRGVEAPWTTAESVVLKARAGSLREIFASGAPLTTSLGVRAWLGLLTNAALQPYCHLEGFNLAPSSSAAHARARIGIVGNEQADCTSPDSFIGVGTSASVCTTGSWAAGNRSCHGADHSAPAFAAVLVRPDDFSGLDARPSCSAHLEAGRRIDGIYSIAPDESGAPFPVYCDMSTAGGGWTLLMRIASGSSSHVLDNGALGEGPCLPESLECKVATSTIDRLIAQEGTQVFAVRPDGVHLPWFLRAESDIARWPPNLEASNRGALASDARHAWILTSYPQLPGAELLQDGHVGDWEGAGHYYPTLYAPHQMFFRGSQTGLRSMLTWGGTYADQLSGALWIRTSGYEHHGVAESCRGHLALGHTRSGVYLVGEPQAPRRAYCDMTTRGGGWTVLASYSGADGEAPLMTLATRADGSPFDFGHLSLGLAEKVALSAGASESLLVRAGGRWLHVDEPLFHEEMLEPGSDGSFDVTVTSDDGASVPASVGWALSGTVGGGDFGISVHTPRFDRHNPTLYRMLNASCVNMLLYSYSVQVHDGDAGYDVNTPLGSWTATHRCEPGEGGRLRFYVAVR